MALHCVFPEFDLDEENGSSVGRLSYPRPISEPPSPTSSRATTPIPSDQSDQDDDEVDEEREVICFLNTKFIHFTYLNYFLFLFFYTCTNSFKN